MSWEPELEELRRREALAREMVRSPFRAAERFGVEEIIDPRDTRPLLCAWAKRAHQLIAHEVGDELKGARMRP